MSGPLNRLRQLFWDAFHVPDLQSEKYQQRFKELEPINDQIAGPLYSVFENGHCDYVFADKERFANIQEPEDLQEWLAEMIRDYAESAAELKPENEEEEKDIQVLMYQADIKMELTELAYQHLIGKKE